MPSLSLEELKDELLRYQEQTAKTGKQLGWDYAEAAFPYTIESKPDAEGRWFYLKGTHPMYHAIVFGTGVAERGGKEVHYAQVVLPDGSTHGDKNKAIELLKYIARNLQAELHLFNGRVMYYNPKK